LCLGETNAASKSDEEDYEKKRKRCSWRMAREQVAASVTPPPGDPTRT
jgi:hypothetical protein